MKEIPEVPTYKFLGAAGKILKNPLPFHRRNFEEKGDTFRLKLGFGKDVVFSRDAKFAQYALQKNQKNYDKSPIQTRDLAKYVGKGLLTSNGKHWARQRKMIQPAFHKKQLVNLLDKVQEAVTLEIAKVKTDSPFDIFPVFNDLAFQTVVKALFSSAVNQDAISKLQQITEEAQAMMVRELRQPYLKWWFHLSGKLKYTLEQTKEARRILHELVDTRVSSGDRQDDLLDMLLDARYDDDTAMDREQLIDEILILFTAGHETTSNALTFTAELLAQHPEIQEKLYQEVAEATQEIDLMQRIKMLTYTNQVLNESMRLYPPAYFIDRISLEADSFNDMEIKAGTSLLFSIHEIHRHKEFWKDPDAFIPERFEEDTTIKYSPYYYPFGAGPRMCIGNNFAMYEMILAVAELVKQYRIEPKSTPIEINPLITLKPKNAILKFTLRGN